MRSDNLQLLHANQAPTKTPYIVVELSFDEANTDLLYLTSHDEADTPDGATVISGVLEDVSGTSQRLDIKNFNSTIGNMRFSVVDEGGAFSSRLRTKLASDLSITDKRVRFYLGYENIDFDQYALIQTQIVENEQIENNTYTINCYDVQRQQRKEIFERKETVLTQNVDSDDTVLTVLKTDGFETYYHGTSYSVNPSSTVGHILVVDGDRKERMTYTGKTANTFTGLTRGAFGDEPLDFVASENGKSRNVKVYEYIYLEMPAVKLAYAILTGSLYNDAATLPAHWNLGIDSQYVATSQFTTIGNDWWDSSDDTKGRSVRFEGLTKEDGKKFIETELYGLLGCFSPILSTGEMGLSRLTSIVSSANYAVELNETNITKASKAVYAHDQVVNFVRVDWGYDNDDEKYRRSNFFYDGQSRTRHGLSDLKTLRFKGLHSAKHSVDHVRAMFDGYRDRFAGPPITLNLTLLPSLNVLEVGDVVRVNLANYPDYFGNGDLDRSFEVQQVSVDWSTGKVQVKVAGSTQRATPLVNYEGDATIPSATAVPDSAYTNAGTNIETAFAANVSRSGSVVTLDSDITLAGGAMLSAGVFYIDGDFTIPFGRTLSIDDNVMLLVKGFFNCHGKIDGKGRGPAGEDYRRYMNPIAKAGAGDPPDASFTKWNERIDGAYPATLDADQFPLYSNCSSAPALFLRGFNVSISSGSNSSLSILGGNTGTRSIGKPTVLPFVDVDPSDLGGLPGTLWGRGGTAGGPNYTNDDPDPTYYNPRGQGGSGGNGGAGLAIVCRGMDFGAGGQIDLSGDDGQHGTYHVRDSISVKAGDSAPGQSGCLYILVDGASNSAPVVDGTTVVCDHGDRAEFANFWGSDWKQVNTAFAGIFGWNNLWETRGHVSGSNNFNRPQSLSYYPSPHKNFIFSGWESRALVQFLIAPTAAQDTPDEITEKPLGIALTEYTNTPQTPEGDQSTIDITVTPPSATNYSYSIIEARKSGATAWETLGPAQHERSFTTKSDGSTWEFRALAVSTTGNVLSSGPIQSTVTTDFSSSPASVRPATNVTGLRLSGKALGQNTFDTPDLQFTWNLDHASGTGKTDSWFSHFVVEIRKGSDGSLLSTEIVKTNSYVLTFSENTQLTDGPHNSIQVRVYQVTVDGTNSPNSTQATFANAAPGAPSNFTITPGVYDVVLKWDNPTSKDYSATEIYLSTNSNPAETVANRVFLGDGRTVTAGDLQPNTTYYFKARTRDVFGLSSSYTSVQSFTTGQPDWSDLQNIPTDLWEGGNLISASTRWDVGNGSVDIFSHRGNPAEQLRAVMDGPFGNKEIVWTAIPSGDGGGDGGWETEEFNIDTSKTYIFGGYVKKLNANGLCYFGCGSNTNNLDGSPNANPYFIGGHTMSGFGGFEKWYLYIGVLHHSSYSGTDNGLSGVYDLETGAKLYDGAEFKSSGGAQRHRLFHEANLTGDGSTTYQWMARPFVVEGNNFPGVDALTKKLGGVAANATRNLVFRQDSQPTGENAGDLWIDTDDNNRVYYFNGSAWQDSADLRIAQALADAANAQSTADGKIVTYSQATAPTGADDGDIWFDTDDGYKIYRYNGSSWVPSQDADIAQAISDASTAQATADGKVTTFFSTTTPTADADGDLWYNSDTKLFKRWNGSAWVDVSSLGADWNDNVSNKPSADQIPINLFDVAQWASGGTGDQGRFTAWPGSGGNSIVEINGPFGERQKAWRAAYSFGSSSSGFEANYVGAANGGSDEVSPEASYRITAYFKTSSAGIDCEIGFGNSVYSDGSTLASQPTAVSATSLDSGEWFLFVVILHSEAWTGAQSGLSGVYRVSTGEKVISGSDYGFRQDTGTNEQVFPRLMVTSLASGQYCDIAKPKCERITDATVPIISLLGAADNTQVQVDAGSVKGIDSFNSSGIYARLHQKLFYEESLGSYSTTTIGKYGQANLLVDDASAAQYDYMERTYQAHVDTALDDWNNTKSRKFKCRVDMPSNNINPNLLVSVASGAYYYSSGGTLHAKGFGFYTDSSGDFHAFVQTSTTDTNPPTTIAMGGGLANQITGYIDLEADFNRTTNVVTFTVKNLTGGDKVQTISLSFPAAPQGNAYNACTIRTQKIGTATNQPPWNNGLSIGTVLFQQD